MKLNEISRSLSEKKLRVTPQRLAVYSAIITLNNHPTAEEILQYVRKKNPNIAAGTVYKVLESLVEHQLVMKVKTDRDYVRYEAVIDKHHHLYCSESDKIADYFNPEIDALLKEYFIKNNIPGFNIEDVKLQIKGKFIQ